MEKTLSEWVKEYTKEKRGVDILTFLKSQLSDEEYLQVSEQLLRKHLFDLYAEPTRTDCLQCPLLEIQPSPAPDWTPR